MAKNKVATKTEATAPVVEAPVKAEVELKAKPSVPKVKLSEEVELLLARALNERFAGQNDLLNKKVKNLLRGTFDL